VVFSALPNYVSAIEADRHRSNGSTVIDLSGDLRFPTAESYNDWHDKPHPAPHLLPAPYCLPEYPHIAGKHTPNDPRHTSLAPGRKLASIPGCYPTATLLALLPLLSRNLIDMQGMPVIVDADSGISGRGKKPTEDTHYMSVSNNAVPYKTGREHRHVGEMELFLDDNEVFFSPTTIAIERGMLVKATARLAFGVTPGRVRQAFSEAYSENHTPFVKVLADETLPTIQETIRTDECHIGFVVVKHTIQIGSSLDNLRKGAASQAVQAFNIMHGLDETSGLKPQKDWRPLGSN
jgi:N-acetyl-gamma-glutamyl-phosphate reductase